MVMTVLTTVSVVATFNSNTSSGFGGTSGGKDFRCCLSSMKTTALDQPTRIHLFLIVACRKTYHIHPT
jgi:hypothetical protein